MKHLILAAILSLAVFLPGTAEAQSTDPDLQGLAWNRWTTNNFTILSIDQTQGEWLYRNIETIKTWSITRWGFPDYNFTKECRIMCVPDKETMKKLFGIEHSYYEEKISKQNTLEMTAIWLVLDDKPSRVVPPLLTRACLTEFEEVHRVKLGLWAKIGMSELNGTLPDIRQKLNVLSGYLKQDEPMYFSKALFTMTQEDYKTLDDSKREMFITESVAMCLLLRKEFGEAKMQGYLRIAGRNDTENALKVVYGFRDYNHFDGSFKRYMGDLSSDVVQKKTPDSYLEVAPVVKR